MPELGFTNKRISELDIFQAADFRQHDAFGSGDCYRENVVEVIDVLQAVDADVDALARIGERGDHRGGIFTRNLLVMYRRSEEHTSELQSRENLVCRLL